MKIGVKSIFCLFLFVFLISIVVYTDFFIFKNLLKYEPITLSLIGFFTIVSLSILMHFYGGKDSEVAFYVSKDYQIGGDAIILCVKDVFFALISNRKKVALEFPLSIQMSILFLAIFYVNAFTINDRTLMLLSDITKQFDPSSSEYCIKVEKKKKKVDKPGCELVLRAAKMGLSDKLGDCKPEEYEESGELSQVCKLRQLDEPQLHYTYRKLAKKMISFVGIPFIDVFNSFRNTFREQVKEIELLGDHQGLVMNATPRASHHILTNLPPPKGKWFHAIYSAMFPGDCIDRYAELPNILQEGEDSLSHKFEFVIAHLLFTSTHNPSAGYCREYQIHWGLESDICRRIVANPLEGLEEAGAKDHLDLLLHREQVQKKMDALAKRIEKFAIKKEDPDKDKDKDKEKNKDKDKDKAKKALDPFEKLAAKKHPITRAASFHCFMVGEDETDVIASTVKVNDFEFQLFEVHTSSTLSDENAKIPVNWFKKTATVLHGNFRYAGFLSRKALANRSQGDLSHVFNKATPFLLAKTQALTGIDIMLGDEWLHNRLDLLSVYPWSLHMHHFIKVFRKKFRAKWQRL
ncbi:MAG: hypothetical protein HRU09_10020 [Oligoflexales bacterium]|nr:hypothetical protein [Oligoflexales bacterium]